MTPDTDARGECRVRSVFMNQRTPIQMSVVVALKGRDQGKPAAVRVEVRET